MQLEEAIKSALDGHALLFVGAGFSSVATNLDNEPFPISSKFAESLCDEMGCPKSTNLSLVSDMYMANPSFGIPRIIDRLGRAFQLKTTGDYETTYQTIRSIPWIRIYTTNYDNLCEATMLSVGIGAC